MKKPEQVKDLRPKYQRAPSTDDSLIMIRATKEDAVKLQEILNIYEACSGQIISKDKSAIFTSA